jgi:hypothetical protein
MKKKQAVNYKKKDKKVSSCHENKQVDDIVVDE